MTCIGAARRHPRLHRIDRSFDEHEPVRMKIENCVTVLRQYLRAQEASDPERRERRRAFNRSRLDEIVLRPARLDRHRAQRR